MTFLVLNIFNSRKNTSDIAMLIHFKNIIYIGTKVNESNTGLYEFSKKNFNIDKYR